MILKNHGLNSKRNVTLVVLAGFTIVFLSLLFLNYYEGKFINVHFSHDSGIYEAPITLKIFNPIINSQLKYTVDGTDPVPSSDTFNRQLEISTTTTVKAAVYRGDKKISGDYSKTYLVSENSKLPILTLDVSYYDFFDPRHGIYTEYNQRQKGPDMKRTGVLEMYETNSNKVFSVPVDVRLFGGETRKNAQKTLKVCASGEEEFNYQIFPNSQQDKYKCLLLRGSGNDWNNSMLRDGFMQSLVREISFIDTQNYRPAILFINGEYWGIHNIREVYDKFYFRDKYDIRAADVVMLFPNRENQGAVDIEEGKPGDDAPYNTLLKVLEKEDISSERVYQKVSGMMDIESYIDYMIFETFFGNHDWIESNIKIWYYKGIDKDEREDPALDGRLRWLIYDLDGAFGPGNLTDNYIQKSTMLKWYDGTKWRFLVFRRLLMNSEFKEKFLQRYRSLLGSELSTENVLKKLDEAAAVIEGEMPRQIERWKDTLNGWKRPYLQSMEEWKANLDIMRTHAKERPGLVESQLKLLEGVAQ